LRDLVSGTIAVRRGHNTCCLIVVVDIVAEEFVKEDGDVELLIGLLFSGEFVRV